MTPHIKAQKSEIAKTVLMPGDPLRAKAVATNFLTNVKRINTIRNMLMYTGQYKGRLISVCGSGMGQPSIGIYSYELFHFYDVKNIIRIGSAGAYRSNLQLYDIVLVKEAYSDAPTFNKLVANDNSHLTKPSAYLNAKIKHIAQQKGIKIQEVRAHSSDVFYSKRNLNETIKETKADCVEMEAGALFANAKALKKEAACLLTISDNLVTKAKTSPEERQNNFMEMVKIALELAN